MGQKILKFDPLIPARRDRHPFASFSAVGYKTVDTSNRKETMSGAGPDAEWSGRMVESNNMLRAWKGKG